MRKLVLKLVLPYNWYHTRKIRIHDQTGKLLTKLMHCDHQIINLDDTTESIVIRLDYFKSEIPLPKNNEDLNLGVYLDFRDRFPIKYFDILNRRCLTGRLMNDSEFAKFSPNFYQQSHLWIQKAEMDSVAVAMGVLISAAIILIALVEQHNPYQDLLFFIGLSSLCSMLLLYLEKSKLLFFDYRNRLIATGLAFILAAFFTNSFAIATTLLLFAMVFLLKTVKNVVMLRN